MIRDKITLILKLYSFNLRIIIDKSVIMKQSNSHLGYVGYLAVYLYYIYDSGCMKRESFDKIFNKSNTLIFHRHKILSRSQGYDIILK